MKNTLQVNTSQVQAWLKTHHRINGELTSLVGDVDCNFKCQAEHSTYTVKISRVINTDGFDFETALDNRRILFQTGWNTSFTNSNIWAGTANKDSLDLLMDTLQDGMLLEKYDVSEISERAKSFRGF